MLVLVFALAAFAAGNEINATVQQNTSVTESQNASAAKNATVPQHTTASPQYTTSSPGIVIDGQFKYGIVTAPFTACYSALEEDYFAEIVTIECMASQNACSPLPMMAYLTDNASIAPKNDDEYFTPPETSLQLIDNLIEFTAEMRVARTTVMHAGFRMCIDTRSSGFWCKIDTMTAWVPRDNLPTDDGPTDTLSENNVSEKDPAKDSSSGNGPTEEDNSGENLSEDEDPIKDTIIIFDDGTTSTPGNDVSTETTGVTTLLMDPT